jgi:prevent-host-death family protein
MFHASQHCGFLAAGADGRKILVMAHSFGPPRKKPRPRQDPLTIAAADFKTRCLQLMDRVRETGVEYTITKHGTPVARLVPVNEPARPSFFGAGKGSVLHYERPFDPIDGAYDIDREA